MVAGHNNQVNTEYRPIQAEPANCALWHIIVPVQRVAVGAQCGSTAPGYGKTPPGKQVPGGVSRSSYLAGAVKGALTVVKYWMAAPIATGAVMKI
jgi:hypothetical protein